MARGERFVLDLDDDGPPEEPLQGTGRGFSLVKDIAERPLDGATPPPRPPSPRTTTTGFPEPKVKPLSRFKQKQQASQAPAKPPAVTESAGKNDPDTTSANASTKDTLGVSERHRIDRENKEVIARMSEEEIARERAELLAGGIPGLTTSLIERLLKRANLEDGGDDMSPESHQGSTRKPPPRAEAPEDQTKLSAASQQKPRVTFADTPSSGAEDTPVKGSSSPSKPTISHVERPPPLSHDPEAAPLIPPSDLQPVRSKAIPSGGPAIHFPTPAPNQTASSSGSLDITSDTFLSDMREKYFPHLSADPGSLAWMQPLPDATAAENAAYSPAADSVAPSALRFDFRGALVAPSVAATLPTTLGLHHHGSAPASAGYTIGELARLQRSAVPAQRAVAHQTLGRVLYRLGKGNLGQNGEDLVEGLWAQMATHRVIESLLAEAALDEHATNRTAWAAATEAAWLWRKAGGRGGEEFRTR